MITFMDKPIHLIQRYINPYRVETVCGRALPECAGNVSSDVSIVSCTNCLQEMMENAGIALKAATSDSVKA